MPGQLFPGLTKGSWHDRHLEIHKQSYTNAYVGSYEDGHGRTKVADDLHFEATFLGVGCLLIVEP